MSILGRSTPTSLRAFLRLTSPSEGRIAFSNIIVRRVWISTTTFTRERDLTTARTWLQHFEEVPRDVGDVSYSRSSGPGGQSVNKVNSKAQLRVPLDRLLKLVPPALHATIRASRYYAGNTDSLLIQADDSRKQATNKETCYRKLNEMLLDIGKKVIPGETCEGQKEKVKALKQFETEARLKSKKQHSNKKASRSKNFGDQ